MYVIVEDIFFVCVLKELLFYCCCYFEYCQSVSEVDEICCIEQVQLLCIVVFIEVGEFIEFVLLVFLVKLLNFGKVFDSCLDMVECLLLLFFNYLCQCIQLFYVLGVKIIVCFDGWVFGDLVRIGDVYISVYQDVLCLMIEEIGVIYIGVFNLEDVCVFEVQCDNYEQFCQLLIDGYVELLESICEILLVSEEGLLLYCVIICFFYEDGLIFDYQGLKIVL